MSPIVNRKTLKRAVLAVSHATGVTALGRHLTRKAFNIVGFHGVSLEDEHVRFPTLFISPTSFERRLRFLSAHYDIVPLAEAVAQHHERRVKPRQVVLTFDDGFYNFLAVAIPILKQFRAPATVYTPTADIESGEPTYNLLARDIVLSTPLRTATGLPDRPDRVRDVSTTAARNSVAVEVLQALNATCGNGQQRLDFCRTLGRVLEVDVDAKLRARLWDRLTPSEVRDVVTAGYDLQLHTHNHRNVVENRHIVRDEVRTNRETLERLSGRPAVHFCYPSGLWSRDVWPDLIAEGVQSAVTTKNGPNYPDTPVLALRRYLTGEAMSEIEFAFDLSGVRWLGQTMVRPAVQYEPSEKRLRYRDQPDLY